MQDLDGLLLFARKRARDEKASVRKSGIQLLDSLLTMSIRGAGGAASQAPSPGDLESIEIALSDPLVPSNASTYKHAHEEPSKGMNQP